MLSSNDEQKVRRLISKIGLEITHHNTSILGLKQRVRDLEFTNAKLREHHDAILEVYYGTKVSPSGK
jgi:hypothetical protein